MIKNHTAVMTRKYSAFTWLEWLGIISIPILLAVMVLPQIYIGDPANKSEVDLAHLRQIVIAMHVYAKDNDSAFPLHPRDTTEFVVYGSRDIGDVYLSPYQDVRFSLFTRRRTA